MSQDLKDAKRAPGSVYPEAVYDSGSGVERVEPQLDAATFTSRFLFGIPLISPITKERVTPEMIADYLKRSRPQVELDAKVEISPVTRRVRLPFDPVLYEQNIWCEVPHKPIQKVIRLFISSASYVNTPQQNDQYPPGAQIYTIPNDWIDMSYAVRGKVFVNPINPAFAAIGTGQAAASSGAAILQFIGQQRWVPAYWTIEATFGFCSEDGNVPIIINELVGQKAAMLLIDNLIPLFRTTSQSLGVDGLSQSVSDQLQTLLQSKRKQLEADYLAGIKKIKMLTGNINFVSNV